DRRAVWAPRRDPGPVTAPVEPPDLGLTGERELLVSGVGVEDGDIGTRRGDEPVPVRAVDQAARTVRHAGPEHLPPRPHVPHGDVAAAPGDLRAVRAEHRHPAGGTRHGPQYATGRDVNDPCPSTRGDPEEL